MKRTFGKFLSLMLVLAMLLAMVPAVLAADTTKTFTAAMGVGDEIVFPRAGDVTVGTLGEKTTWSLTTGRYGSASDYAALRYSSGATTVVTAKKATGSTTLTLTAKTTTGTGRDTVTYYNYWTVTITAWGITLSPDPMNLVGGKTGTLTATVTGPASSPVDDKVDSLNGGLSEAKVTFESNNTKAFTVASSDPQEINSRRGTATTVVTAANDTGEGLVTAKLSYTQYYTYYTNKQEVQKAKTVSVEESASVYVTKASDQTFSIFKGSTDVTNKVISATTSTASFTLTASLSGDTTGKYSWTSDDTSVATIGRSDGKVTIKGEGTTTITVTSLADSTKKATCEISVSNETLTIDSITYSDSTINDLETKELKFSSVSPAITNYTVNTVDLVANLGDYADASAVTWTIDKPSLADFNGNTKAKGGEVTLKAKNPGEVKVTATITNANGKTDSKSMTIRIWTAKEYNKQEKPSISFTASTALNALKELESKVVTVTLTSTGAKVSLPVKNAHIDGSGDSVQIIADIDGADSKNYIIYYPKNDSSDTSETAATGTVSYSLTSDSDILFYEQPVSKVTYKVTDTFEPLYTYFKVTKSQYYITSVAWYDVATHNKLQEVTYDLADAKTVLSSTFDLSKNGNITGPGDYTYQCIVTAKNSKGNSVTGVSTGSTVTVAGDYFVEITAAKTAVSVGDTFTVSGVAQTYNPSSKKYVDVSAAHNLTWTLSDSSLATLSKTTSAKGATINVTATAGGKLVLTAKTTINGKDYEGTKTITISTPKADDVRVTLGDDDTYVMLDGSKISDAVKAATKSTPSTFMFKQPSYGTVYTSSSLSSAISTTTKYSASEVSKMAFKPTRTAGSYTIEYTAYVSNGELATGKIIVMTSSGTVTYHISANEAQAMQESDFRNVYSGTLKSVRFGSTGDSRGSLYKGSTTGSGKIDTTTSYFISSQASTGASLLSNVNFIAGSSTSKYSVTIPFTAYGTAGDVEGNLVVYVNDTHSIYSTGATLKSMSIADELAPESGASSAYLTITGVTGGKLYTQYTSITSCTELSSKEYNSTKFYFSGSNSVDNLYVLPKADATAVVVSYTINGSTKGSVNFKVVQQTASQKFKDVSGSTKWASNSVDFMSGNGLVNGISTKDPTVFGPNQSMTRAMLVTILYRAAGQPSVAGITNKFTDNKDGQYYYNAVLWASNNGIVNGATAKTFDPDGKITREQIAAILYRYAGSPTANTSALNSFTDRTQVSSYATTAMQWAVGNGIITGVSSNGRTTLSAKNNATRAQVAVMLHRFLTLDK